MKFLILAKAEAWQEHSFCTFYDLTYSPLARKKILRARTPATAINPTLTMSAFIVVTENLLLVFRQIRKGKFLRLHHRDRKSVSIFARLYNCEENQLIQN